jgi:spermidine synthase
MQEYRSKSLAGSLAAAILVACLLAWKLPPIPGNLIAYGRRLAISAANSTLLYTEEGRNSSVAITQWSDGAIEIDVNGHVEATTEVYDMKLQRMVGHLPALLHPNPKSILGIGFGAGVSAGTFTRYPGIRKITICEIEPIIPRISTRSSRARITGFSATRAHAGGFRRCAHYHATTDMFDIIASDPLDVFAKRHGRAVLREYFDAVKRHLNPGGVFTLYVPLYEAMCDREGGWPLSSGLSARHNLGEYR